MARISMQEITENKYNSLEPNLKSYFNELDGLLQNHSWEVCLSYVFLKSEEAHHRLLYGGVIKLYWTNTTLTKNTINKEYMSREDFKKYYKNIFGIENKHLSILKKAEDVRDTIIHGKKAADTKIAEAITFVLDYAIEINKTHTITKYGGFRPFGSMQGFKGAAGSYDLKTTRLVLKGLGFSLS